MNVRQRLEGCSPINREASRIARRLPDGESGAETSIQIISRLERQLLLKEQEIVKLKALLSNAVDWNWLDYEHEKSDGTPGSSNLEKLSDEIDKAFL